LRRQFGAIDALSLFHSLVLPSAVFTLPHGKAMGLGSPYSVHCYPLYDAALVCDDDRLVGGDAVEIAHCGDEPSEQFLLDEIRVPHSLTAQSGRHRKVSSYRP
jgi:hypothetical protein